MASEVLKAIRSSPTSLSLLQELHCLDGSLSGFHDRLCNVLYGEEYQRDMPNLQDDDLVRLVDYLDKVCCHVAHPHPLLEPV